MAPTRDALRVQAAAVAAQQAALTEDEVRLRQQRQALDLQQTQLVAHLDEKRARLIELRDQSRRALAELKAERAKYERSVAQTARQLEVGRADIAEAQRQVEGERERVRRLHRRLKRRWHRHWLAERTAQRRREVELATRSEALARDRQFVQSQKEDLYRARCRFNGEVEVGRRQLQADRDQFQQEQRAWQERRAQELRELEADRRQLDERAAAQADAARDLAEQQRRWQERRAELETETTGLDRRIHNQRRKLLEQEEALNRLESRRPPVIPAADPAEAFRESTLNTSGDCPECQRRQQQEKDFVARAAALEKVAEDLGDQRLHVAEECARLEEAGRRWQELREAAAAELEPLARGLRERERAVEAREQEQRLRREEVERLRQYLCAWQAHLDRRAAAWDAERQRLLADLQSWEEESAAGPAEQRDLSRLRQKVLSLQSQANVYEQQIRDLNDAVERLACALLDGRDGDDALPAARAA